MIKKMTDAQALAEFRNPAMQFDYFEAQKAYMKAGTPELAEMLSDILVERISESSRSLLQIALGEAIRVAPKLIPAQMATLALIFNIRYSHTPQVDHYDRLVFYLKGQFYLYLKWVSAKTIQSSSICILRVVVNSKHLERI